MSRTLQMIFRNKEGRNVILSLADAREELDPVDVQLAMNNLVSRNIFDTAGGEIVEGIRAQLVSRYVETIVEF